MNDRELLELAAKAVGYDTSLKVNADRLEMSPPVISLWVTRDGVVSSTAWNPLAKDGDALRLVVRLRMDIRTASTSHRVFVGLLSPFVRSFEEIFDEDPLPATRRAIVRAAAEIGRAMP